MFTEDFYLEGDRQTDGRIQLALKVTHHAGAAGLQQAQLVEMGT